MRIDVRVVHLLREVLAHRVARDVLQAHGGGVHVVRGEGEVLHQVRLPQPVRAHETPRLLPAALGHRDGAARAGDETAARLQATIGEEEIPHVAFGAHWFTQWRGALDFDDWAAQLPAPMSPMLMRGKPINREDRLRAGYPEAFLDRLAAWQPEPR